ncbi:hypothetical protein SUGI_0538500 [Cryptomeria japonica]|nr:hypothetical protein SUGI_0538500 [Cryptomeria japonica]
MDVNALQVVNHGFPHSLLDTLKRIGKDFFQLPLEKKQSYSLRPGDLQGYSQTFVVENVNAYNTETKKLAEQLLALVAESLQLPPHFFVKKFDNAFQRMRMNYYPPCLSPDLVLGLSAHADMVALTLLLQDDQVLGLQIHKDDQWRSVKPIPYALVINIGNLLEVMTNGRYKSIVHRAVTNKEKERLSIGVFYAPGFTQEISPSPELIDDNHPCLFRKFIHEDYMQDYYTRGAKAKDSFYEFAGIKNEPNQKGEMRNATKSVDRIHFTLSLLIPIIIKIL